LPEVAVRSTDGIALLAGCVSLFVGVSLPLGFYAGFDEPYLSITEYLLDVLLASLFLYPLAIVVVFAALPFVSLVVGIQMRVSGRCHRHRGFPRARAILLAPVPFLLPCVVWCFFWCCARLHVGGLLVREPGWLSWWGIQAVGSGWLWVAGTVLMILNAAWSVSRVPGIPVEAEALHCDCCGYNLTGNESGVCPECGVACEIVGGRP
jgi:hypothetical protein